MGLERTVLNYLFKHTFEIQGNGVELALLCIPEKNLDAYVNDL